MLLAGYVRPRGERDAVVSPNGKPGRYRPDDKLLAFLNSLSQYGLCPARMPFSPLANGGATPGRDIVEGGT
jgi:hypothetical protein